MSLSKTAKNTKEVLLEVIKNCEEFINLVSCFAKTAENTVIFFFYLRHITANKYRPKYVAHVITGTCRFERIHI